MKTKIFYFIMGIVFTLFLLYDPFEKLSRERDQAQEQLSYFLFSRDAQEARQVITCGYIASESKSPNGDKEYDISPRGCK